MKFNTYNLFEITQSIEDLDFLPSDYSRFKYGSKSIAREFGTLLGLTFISHIEVLVNQKHNGTIYEKDEAFLDSFMNKQIVVVSSPYDFIPTATFAMKDYFIAAINEKFVDLGLESVQETRISRDRSYNDDYGLMTAEERKNLIAGDHFHIDSEFVKGKFILFLDDVFITGGHESKMQEMVSDYDLDIDYMYMYLGAVMDKTVPANIEHYLNHAFVKDLWDVATIIRDDEFLFNTRVVKFILSSDELSFCIFIAHQSEGFRQTLYHYLLGNKYHKLQVYEKNYLHLKNQDWMDIIKSPSLK